MLSPSVCRTPFVSKLNGTAVVLESFAKGEAPGSGAMPACIVLERWDYSLSDWNNKLQRQPDDVELKSALYMVSFAIFPPFLYDLCARVLLSVTFMCCI